MTVKTAGAPGIGAVVAVAMSIAVVLTGCSGTSTVDPASTPVAAVATSSPMPIEQVVDLDPLAEPLVAAGRELVSATEGFASVEARTALAAAVQQLESDVQVVQLSMAGGPAASQASPPVDEARIAESIAGLSAAIGGVRTGVIETAARVVNDETPDAPRTVRDQLYTAIVAEQTAVATTATDDTARRLLELVALTRAAQNAQVEGAAAAEAAHQAEESPSGGDESGSSTTVQRFEPQLPPGCTRIDETSWTCPHTPGEPFVFPPWVPVG